MDILISFVTNFFDTLGIGSYGIGCRMTTGFQPWRRSSEATSLDSGLLPQPVRTAQTETTGTVDLICVRSVPKSQKSAPAATTRDARCIRFWWEISLSANTT